jgi:hypothetical protein
MPHDPHAERLVLSGAMRDGDRVFAAAADAGLVAADFYDYAHRLVYATAFDLWNGFRPCDPASVYRVMRRRGDACELGLRPALWLADVYDEPPWPAAMPEARDYPACGMAAAAPVEAIDDVIRHSQMRDVIHAALAAIAEARDGHMSPRPRLKVFREAVAV